MNYNAFIGDEDHDKTFIYNNSCIKISHKQLD